MNVIVDSCIFISIYDKRDSNHQRATDDLVSLTTKNYTLWITEYILDEIMTIFIKRSYKRQLKSFIDQIASEQVQVFFPKNSFEAEKIRTLTLKRVLNQKKVKASFTDMYSLVVAHEGFLPRAKILSYDQHLSAP